MKWALYCFSSRKDLEIARFGRIVKYAQYCFGLKKDLNIFSFGREGERGGVYQLWNDHDIIGLNSSRKKDLKVVSCGKERERELPAFGKIGI